MFRKKHCDHLKEGGKKERENEIHPKEKLVKEPKNDISMEENSSLIFIFQKRNVVGSLRNKLFFMVREISKFCPAYFTIRP